MCKVAVLVQVSGSFKSSIEYRLLLLGFISNLMLKCSQVSIFAVLHDHEKYLDRLFFFNADCFLLFVLRNIRRWFGFCRSACHTPGLHFLLRYLFDFCRKLSRFEISIRYHWFKMHFFFLVVRFFRSLNIEGASFIESYNIRMIDTIFHFTEHNVVHFNFLFK